MPHSKPAGGKQRKEMYAYLETLGVAITPDVHANVKTIMLEHDDVRFMELIDRLQEANNEIYQLKRQLGEVK